MSVLSIINGAQFSSIPGVLIVAIGSGYTVMVFVSVLVHVY